MFSDSRRVGAFKRLGVMYTYGAGVLQNFAEAVRWYRLAADQGLAGSQYSLGNIYAHGEGVPQDYVLAHMRWSLTASQRNEDAVENRNRVAGMRTPAQIAEAQRLASAWVPQ